MNKPIIVTGCGRSGTHWLANILEAVHGEGRAEFEPVRYWKTPDVVVDSRLRHRVNIIAEGGHRIVHLVRDGREVVRSLHRWYGGNHDFERYCHEWDDAVRMMEGYPAVRLEDLLRKGDPSSEFLLPHWTDWDERTRDTFWNICGASMARHGYER